MQSERRKHGQAYDGAMTVAFFCPAAPIQAAMQNIISGMALRNISASYEEFGRDYGVFDVLEDSINWLELIFEDKSSQFFRFKRKFRVCLDFTSIHSKRIFRRFA